MKPNIRIATKTDLPAIHALVRELAIYEKEEHEFVATIEDYRKDFDAGWFESIVAELDGEVVGMMLYYETYSTWKGRMLYLEDFVIQQSKRKLGIGQLLLEEFLKVAREKKCKVTKWQVLDWNEPAIKFYEKNKAALEKNWWNCKLPIEIE